MTIEYGTRPYIEKDGDELQHVDRMRKNTYFNQFNALLEKHSELMKPYADDGDFPQMEHFAPSDFKNPEGDGPGDGIPTADSNKGVCVISCYAPLYCDDPVECHMSRMETPPGMDPREAMSHVWMTALENHSDGSGWHYVEGTRLNLQSKMKKADLKKVIAATPIINAPPTPVKLQANKASAIFPMTIDPPALGWGKWPENPMTRLIVKAMDPAGNLCETKLNAFCRKQPCCFETGYIAPTFDDGSTPDTIARNDSITVFVLNGCSNYTWAVTGTGFSFAEVTTAGKSNTLTASGSACGTASITVSDDCGNSVYIKIRCTMGVWCTDASKNNTCVMSGSGTGGPNDYELITANFKQLQSISGGGCTGLPPGSICSDVCFYAPVRTCGEWCATATTLSVGQCITPYSNVDAGCIDNPSWCCRYTTSATYQEWKCAC